MSSAGQKKGIFGRVRAKTGRGVGLGEGRDRQTTNHLGAIGRVSAERIGDKSLGEIVVSRFTDHVSR